MSLPHAPHLARRRRDGHPSLLCAAPAAAQTKLLRFPDIHGDRRVLLCGRHLTAPATGGAASRITFHRGLEQVPFSSDGGWPSPGSAMTVTSRCLRCSAEGGAPRQLTFHPAGPNAAQRLDNQVMGWTRDGPRAVQHAPGRRCEARAQSLHCAGRWRAGAALPMYTAGAGDYSPDGQRMVYSPLFRDFRTWKRYQGGWAQDLWIIDLETLAAENITQPSAQRPRSDVGGRCHLLRLRPRRDAQPLPLRAGRPADHAAHALDDVGRALALRPTTRRGIVLRAGRRAARAGHRLRQRHEARDPWCRTTALAMRPRTCMVEKFIEDFAPPRAASGAARGARRCVHRADRVRTRPATSRTARTRTTSGARWSPHDGRADLPTISDRIGGRPAPGSPRRTAWQHAAAHHRIRGHEVRASLVAGREADRLLRTRKGRSTWSTVADEADAHGAPTRSAGRWTTYAWSPGGSFLAFSLSHPRDSVSIRVWSAGDAIRLHQVSARMFNSTDPAWDPDGQYLLPLRPRLRAAAGAQGGATTPRAAIPGSSALALRKDVKNPSRAKRRGRGRRGRESGRWRRAAQ